jgi:cytochrome c-type biogenesis protein CcmH
MTTFAIAAALLLATVVVLLLLPLWRGTRAPAAPPVQRSVNLAILRDQLAEIEREHAEGTLTPGEYDETKSELQRRLLDEVGPGGSEAAAVRSQPARRTAIVLLVLIPLAAIAGYALLGTPRALDPAQTAPQPKMTAEQVAAMVDRLSARLQANPDDMAGWLMLARSYKALGRYDEAVAAFGKAEKAIGDDPDQLASYAEALAMANRRGLAGKPRQLVERALQIDPRHGLALFLAGAAAMEAGDNAQAIARWESLLQQVEPGSEIDQLLRGNIDKLRQGR